MSAWHTRPGRPEHREIAGTAEAVSPGLLYHKWHAYDRRTDRDRRSPAEPTLETKESRQPFLENVARGVNRLVQSSRLYASWYDNYLKALDGVGADQELKASTVWRLVAGFATNPALESGLHLHPLYGFPYLPGSSVRGLVHHVAEMELVEQGIPEGEESRRGLLGKAERIQAVFGSVFIRPLRANPTATPWSVLEEWRRDGGATPEDRKRISALLDRHTGGMVAFYDAVPEPGQEGLLQTDILNPHYPDYYDHQGENPPSDDQDPRPVYFLAIKPGAKLTFRFRADAGVAAEVSRWLKTGLSEWGIGAKTAAGYGYFHAPECLTGPSG